MPNAPAASPGPPMPAYRTVAAPAAARIMEKKSEFIAALSPAANEAAALAFLAAVRAQHRTASHNVYAYILREGARRRYSDDGEPAGTAGLPVLETLAHADVTDCALVVTRYFGGTLLGTGGLVRAYTAAATAALGAANIVTVRPLVTLSLLLTYPEYEAARRILTSAGATLAEPAFTDTVACTATLPAGEEGPVLAALREATRGSAAITVSAPFYGAPGAARFTR